ncbi:hypothetical protein D3C74_326130 [compost metagenome]
MIIAESPFPFVKLGRGYTKIVQNAIYLGNTVLLGNKREFLQHLLQIAEVGFHQNHLLPVSGEPLPCILQRPVILIQTDQPALAAEPPGNQRAVTGSAERTVYVNAILLDVQPFCRFFLKHRDVVKQAASLQGSIRILYVL